METTEAIRIDSDVLRLVKQVKPRYLTISGFVSHLLEKSVMGLDTGLTITERPEGARSEKKVNKEKKEERARAREGYTPEFQEFWKTYQACSHRVNSQSKPKAFEEWRLIVKDKDPLFLTAALNNATKDIERRKAADEFAAQLPDCFRWLRDGKWEVHTEEHDQSHLPPGFTQEQWDAREALYAQLDEQWGVKS